MLEESGVHDDSVEVKGPTQIHNLLELIKKEQNIYDLVFSEVKFLESISMIFKLLKYYVVLKYEYCFEYSGFSAYFERKKIFIFSGWITLLVWFY